VKALAFKIARGIVRFLYSIPGRVRRLWRTLLVWGRVSRIYHESGLEGLRRFRHVSGASRENLRRKVSLRKDTPPSPYPPYRD
jgi:hypothetical protein